jgi:hypothetical protein
MRAKRTGEKEPMAETVRASISFPAGDYAELERLAAIKKVSLAWVVRQATEEYLAKERRDQP